MIGTSAISSAATIDSHTDVAQAVDRLMGDTTAILRMFDLGVTLPMSSAAFKLLGVAPMGLSTDGRNFVQPIVAYDQLVDLVSWRPASPARWHLRLGHAVLLGEEQHDFAAFADKPLTIYPTPLAWLCGSGNGAAVVDWAAYLPFHIWARRILVADRDLKGRLSRALRAPPVKFEIRLEAA